MFDYLIVGSGLYEVVFAHKATAHEKTVFADSKI